MMRTAGSWLAVPIIKRPAWALSENLVSPEAVFLNRRRFVATGLAALAAGCLPLAGCNDTEATDVVDLPPDPTADLYPVANNPAFTVARDLTPLDVSSRHNNFFEFGSGKSIAKAAQKLPIRPWEVKIDGLVEAEQTLAIDDLIRKMPLEERIYRHRCVETWAMVVPWSGFPLKALVDLARPLGSAKFLVMESFLNPEVARTQRQTWYPWPYKEVLRLDEAMNELAFLVTGAYGKPLLNQFGAPLRLALPWKYGFKSIKSLTRFTFVETRPKTMWEEIDPTEYGFWANVNPEVPHRRWSQRMEWMLGSRDVYKTLVYNGYADQVAHMYDLENPDFFY